MFLARPTFSTNHLARREMEDLFSSVFGNLLPLSGSQRQPTVNFYEEGDSFIAEAELPGMTEKEVEISIANDVLTIHGKHDAKEEDSKEGKVTRRSRTFGEFSCSVSLPGEVDADKIDATLKNGILTVTLPKAPAIKPRQITVKNG